MPLFFEDRRAGRQAEALEDDTDSDLEDIAEQLQAVGREADSLGGEQDDE